MRPLLLVLLVILIGTAIYAVTRKQTDPTDVYQPTGAEDTRTGPENDKRLISEQDVPGDPPAVPPVFDVQIEVPEGSEGRIYLHVSEQHGYYADTFKIQVWKKGNPNQVVEFYINGYLKANDTLTLEKHIVPAELPNLGGEMGKSEDWEGEVVYYGRARDKNPETFPEGPEKP